jgi:hypothetical protein
MFPAIVAFFDFMEFFLHREILFSCELMLECRLGSNGMLTLVLCRLNSVVSVHFLQL